MKAGALAVVIALAGCSRTPTARLGQTCQGDDDCTTGLCVGDGHDRSTGRCTTSCGPDTPCPAGWSCSALTARGFAVCARGTGVPDFQMPGR